MPREIGFIVSCVVGKVVKRLIVEKARLNVASFSNLVISSRENAENALMAIFPAFVLGAHLLAVLIVESVGMPYITRQKTLIHIDCRYSM